MPNHIECVASTSSTTDVVIAWIHRAVWIGLGSRRSKRQLLWLLFKSRLWTVSRLVTVACSMSKATIGRDNGCNVKVFRLFRRCGKFGNQLQQPVHLVHRSFSLFFASATYMLREGFRISDDLLQLALSKLESIEEGLATNRLSSHAHTSGSIVCNLKFLIVRRVKLTPFSNCSIGSFIARILLKAISA